MAAICPGCDQPITQRALSVIQFDSYWHLGCVRTCGRCGGDLPDEGSEAWAAPTRSDGHCPGHQGANGGCGAFDANLDWTARTQGDDD